MGLCKMSYAEYSFWISDIDMQLMLYYIHEEMVKSQYYFTKKTEFLKETDMLVQGYAFGELWLGWRKYITAEEESKTMIKLLENIKINLQNKGSEISTEEIQAIHIDDSHFKTYIASPFPVSDLIKITEALIQMVSGTWDIAQNNKNLL